MTDREETSEASLSVVAFETTEGLYYPDAMPFRLLPPAVASESTHALVRLTEAQAIIATLKAEAQERILQALSDNGKWIEETSRLRAERDAAVKDAVPLASIRAIAVEAIRTVVGSPDVRGKDGLYLVDEIESTARAAARLFAAGAAQTKETP